MTVDVLQEYEDWPNTWASAPDGLSPAAAALDDAAIWRRIEIYVAHRWTPRPVEWIVEGPGDFVPPLTPTTVDTTERWNGTGWETATLDPTPLGGLMLPAEGPYRISATVGGGTVPASVEEAYRRLAEYLVDDAGRAGSSSYSIKIGQMEETHDRAPTWVARALQYSGAADLLRQYRRKP